MIAKGLPPGMHHLIVIGIRMTAAFLRFGWWNWHFQFIKLKKHVFSTCRSSGKKHMLLNELKAMHFAIAAWRQYPKSSQSHRYRTNRSHLFFTGSCFFFSRLTVVFGVSCFLFAAGITNLILGEVSVGRQFIERQLRIKYAACNRSKQIIKNWIELVGTRVFNYAQDVSETWTDNEMSTTLHSRRHTHCTWNNPIHFCPRLIKYIYRANGK